MCPVSSHYLGALADIFALLSPGRNSREPFWITSQKPPRFSSGNVPPPPRTPHRSRRGDTAWSVTPEAAAWFQRLRVEWPLLMALPLWLIAEAPTEVRGGGEGSEAGEHVPYLGGAQRVKIRKGIEGNLGEVWVVGEVRLGPEFC